MTQAHFRVDAVRCWPDLLPHAFRVAMSSTPGLVHLVTGGSHGQGLGAEADLTWHVKTHFGQYPAFWPEADPEAVREAAIALAQI